MSEKRCVICNKTFNHHYLMFGRECLDNVYELLGVSKPSKVLNKENYLFTMIAWKHHKFLLNRNKKQELAKKYIALSYLNKMDYKLLDDIKEKIRNDINGISTFSKIIPNTISFTLNDVYKLYNYSQKFNDIIKKIESINWEEVDEKVAKNLIDSISFIFDVSKKANPIYYASFYSMQYTFWQVVIIGGILTDKPLSAKLLSNSLTLFGKQPKNLTIDDESTIEKIKEDEAFNNKIKKLIEQYGNETGEFNLKDYEKGGVGIRFEDGDLLFALHDATMLVNAKKNDNNTWNLEIEINDIYDFTDFKALNEYVDDKNSKFTDIFSTLLNNLGVVSSEYGVIKIYDVKIKFTLNNHEI